MSKLREVDLNGMKLLVDSENRIHQLTPCSIKSFISIDRAITDDEAVELTTGTKKLTLWAKVKNWFSKLKEVKR
jgi:hypothetical protein